MSDRVDYWLFFLADGCPFGLLNAGPRSQTERQAWSEFYETERERRAAEGRGVTCLGVDRAEYRAKYYERMKTGCTHQTTAAG